MTKASGNMPEVFVFQFFNIHQDSLPKNFGTVNDLIHIFVWSYEYKFMY